MLDVSVSQGKTAGAVDFAHIRLGLASAIRPILHRLPRGASVCYGGLLGRVLASNAGDPILRERVLHSKRVFFDRHIGAFVMVDLCDCLGRSHYFTGRYYDPLVPLVVQSYLSDGGVFVDVGANRGIHTLFAAKFLHTRGRVYSFEPNPAAYRVLEAHVTMNGITNCETFHMGLADADGTLSLATPAQSVLASFREVAGEKHTEVAVRRLAAVLDAATCDGPVLVKIDVEGFEHKVVQGMAELLDNPELGVICEITDTWLRETGSSAGALFEMMRAKGFRAYHCTAGHSMLIRPRLRMAELSGPLADFQYEVLFTRKMPSH